jgi:hypothetical protein
MLAELPNGFVLRLRDIHYKRKLEERRQNEAYMRSQQNKNNNNNMPNIPSGISSTALEDVIDEFT